MRETGIKNQGEEEMKPTKIEVKFDPPWNSTQAERESIIADFVQALKKRGLRQITVATPTDDGYLFWKIED